MKHSHSFLIYFIRIARIGDSPGKSFHIAIPRVDDRDSTSKTYYINIVTARVDDSSSKSYSHNNLLV